MDCIAYQTNHPKNHNLFVPCFNSFSMNPEKKTLAALMLVNKFARKIQCTLSNISNITITPTADDIILLKHTN